MARINFKADKTAESTGGGGGSLTPKVRGIYNLQIMEASDGQVCGPEAKNAGAPRTNFRMEIADDDERGQLGQWVYHNVNWIARGTGEKAAGGHGMAVHFLHATNMPFDGEFDFDEQDFTTQGHALIQALLEVEPYDKVKDGRTYENEKYVIREIYTDTNPAPEELPPERAPRKQKAAPAAAGKNGNMVQRDLEEVPF